MRDVMGKHALCPLARSSRRRRRDMATFLRDAPCLPVVGYISCTRGQAFSFSRWARSFRLRAVPLYVCPHSQGHPKQRVQPGELGRAGLMPWVKLDDGFAEHPKIVAAGPLAIALHVSALCYCSRQLTDGFVPDAMLKRLCGDYDGLMYETGGDDLVGVVNEPHPLEVAKALVGAGMWKEVPGGYLIHDYLDYNPSREEVLAKRRSKEIQSAGGKARAAGGERDQHGRFVPAGQSSNSPADDQQDHQHDGPGSVQVYPAPDPGPDPGPHPPDIQLLAPNGAPKNGAPKSPNDMQTYLVNWLRDYNPEAFSAKALPWSVLVKLNGKHGRPTVTTALQRLREAPPEEMVTNAVGLLCNVIVDVQLDQRQAP